MKKLFLILLFACSCTSLPTVRDVSSEQYLSMLSDRLNDNVAFVRPLSVVRTPDGTVFNFKRANKTEVHRELNRYIKVVYGLTDDRKDYYEVSDFKKRQNMMAVASLWHSRYVVDDRNGAFNLMTLNYGESMNLHSSEPFRNQPVGAFCTAFLVRDDIIVTAGHCVNEKDYIGMKVVFGFRMINKNTSVSKIPYAYVYSIKEVIHSEKGRVDFAVCRLDRKVVNRKPLAIASKTVEKGDSVYVIGYPVGIPIKLADNAKVLDVANTEFKATLDTYGGNSGSPVFNDRNEVVGILVKGMQDFVVMDDGTRKTYQIFNLDTPYIGETVTRYEQFVKKLDGL